MESADIDPIRPATGHGTDTGDKAHRTPDARVPLAPRSNDERNPFYVISLPERVAEVRAIAEEVIRWVERADLKATMLVTALGAVFTGEVLLLTAIIDKAPGGAKTVALWLLGFGMLFLLLAGLFAALAVFPRLGNPSYTYRDDSIGFGDLVFFGRLRNIPPGAFVRRIDQSLDDRSLISHYESAPTPAVGR